MISIEEEIKQYFIDMIQCGYDIDTATKKLMNMIENAVIEAKKEEKMDKLEEFRLEVIRLYDEYLDKTEKRNISYGELFHIENLEEKELKDLYNELLEKMEEK